MSFEEQGVSQPPKKRVRGPTPATEPSEGAQKRGIFLGLMGRGGITYDQFDFLFDQQVSNRHVLDCLNNSDLASLAIGVKPDTIPEELRAFVEQQTQEARRRVTVEELLDHANQCSEDVAYSHQVFKGPDKLFSDDQPMYWSKQLLLRYFLEGAEQNHKLERDNEWLKERTSKAQLQSAEYFEQLACQQNKALLNEGKVHD
jgi:hypothetical protein